MCQIIAYSSSSSAIPAVGSIALCQPTRSSSVPTTHPVKTTAVEVPNIGPSQCPFEHLVVEYNYYHPTLLESELFESQKSGAYFQQQLKGMSKFWKYHVSGLLHVCADILYT